MSWRKWTMSGWELSCDPTGDEGPGEYCSNVIQDKDPDKAVEKAKAAGWTGIESESEAKCRDCSPVELGGGHGAEPIVEKPNDPDEFEAKA